MTEIVLTYITLNTYKNCNFSFGHPLQKLIMYIVLNY